MGRLKKRLSTSTLRTELWSVTAVRCEPSKPTIRRSRSQQSAGEPDAALLALRSHSGTLAQARLLPLGDNVVVERAVSQNTHPSSRAPDDLVSVRALAAPTHREIEALAEIFDQYRAHYGEASDASRSASWLHENLSTSRLRVFVAEESARFVGFAITMDVPASLRLAHFWQ